MGMSCASCSARVEKTLNRQPGVRKATVNYASATATVEYDSQNCSPEALQQAVQNAGYDLLIKQDENTPDKVEQAHDKKYRALKFRATWAIVLSVPVMVIGMFFMDMPYANLIMWLFSTPVVFWLGRSFFTSAWKQLKHGTANMDIRSFRLNFEVNAVIYSARVARQMEEIFREDLKVCTQITEYLYGRRSYLVRIKEQFSRLFSPVL